MFLCCVQRGLHRGHHPFDVSRHPFRGAAAHRHGIPLGGSQSRRSLLLGLPGKAKGGICTFSCRLPVGGSDRSTRFFRRGLPASLGFLLGLGTDPRGFFLHRGEPRQHRLELG